MKIKIVTAAVLSLLATTTFAAPTIYGEIDASVDYLPEKNATKANKDVWEISSNISFIRIAVKPRGLARGYKAAIR